MGSFVTGVTANTAEEITVETRLNTSEKGTRKIMARKSAAAVAVALACLTATVVVEAPASAEPAAGRTWSFTCLGRTKASDDKGGWNLTAIATHKKDRARRFQVSFRAKGEKLLVHDYRGGNHTPNMEVIVFDFDSGKKARMPLGSSSDMSGSYGIAKRMGLKKIKEGHRIRMELFNPGGMGTSGPCVGGVA